MILPTYPDATIELGEALDFFRSLPSEMPFRWSLADPHSYRGVYAELGLRASEVPSTAGEIAAFLTSLVGRTFTGWKGGEFHMLRDAAMHVADEGSCSDGDGWTLAKLWLLAVGSELIWAQ